MRLALQYYSEPINILLDAASANIIVNVIIRISDQTEDDEKLNWLKCCKMGRGILVDVAVEVDGGINVKVSNVISDGVKNAIMVAYLQVIDVLVQINPGQI